MKNQYMDPMLIAVCERCGWRRHIKYAKEEYHKFKKREYYIVEQFYYWCPECGLLIAKDLHEAKGKTDR